MNSSRSPSAESGPAVRASQLAEHRPLALGIEEADPARLLVRLDLRDQLQPGVDRVDDRAVGVRDLLAELAEDGVVGRSWPTLPLYVNALRRSPGS